MVSSGWRLDPPREASSAAAEEGRMIQLLHAGQSYPSLQTLCSKSRKKPSTNQKGIDSPAESHCFSLVLRWAPVGTPHARARAALRNHRPPCCLPRLRRRSKALREESLRPTVPSIRLLIQLPLFARAGSPRGPAGCGRRRGSLPSFSLPSWPLLRVARCPRCGSRSRLGAALRPPPPAADAAGALPAHNHQRRLLRPVPSRVVQQRRAQPRGVHPRRGRHDRQPCGPGGPGRGPQVT